MKNVSLIILLLLFFSCKKNVPKVTDFVAIKNSLRAMNEVTTIAEMYDHSMKTTLSNSWFSLNDATDITYKITASLSDLDTIILDFKDSTINGDKRIRRGQIIWSFTESFGALNSIATASFVNYSCNNVKISGTMILNQTATPASEAINTPNSYQNNVTGNLNFTLFNGQIFTVQPILSRDYLKALNFYSGSLNGTDVNGESFSTTTLTPLKKANPVNYGEVPAAVFYNGQFSLTQGSNVGKIWYGYNEQIDNYGFVEWQDAKFNFFLEDY